jgi:hypothetical protein
MLKITGKDKAMLGQLCTITCRRAHGCVLDRRNRPSRLCQRRNRSNHPTDYALGKQKRSGVRSWQQPKVKPNARPYTGTSDGVAKARRAGMDEWIKQAIAASDDTLNNLGSYMVRDQKGHKGVLSVHSTGRAVDLGFTNRKAALKFINTVARNANDLGVECILDYFPKPFGRGWRCNRQRWKRYVKRTIAGAPGGRWAHFEITPQAADSVIFVKAAFLKVFGEIPPKA